MIVPDFVHELGFGNFPLEEKIETFSTYTEVTACPAEPGDNPDIPNTLVRMINHTRTNWTEVWYVANGGYPYSNPNETTLTNFDGMVNESLAFQIDYMGLNQPLLFENMNRDGVFEVGETWEFIIQDYRNVYGMPGSLMNSIGVGNRSMGMQLSSGSIIAVPEPTTMLLLGLGGLMLRKRRA